jgi:hypothetical protein
MNIIGIMKVEIIMVIISIGVLIITVKMISGVMTVKYS